MSDQIKFAGLVIPVVGSQDIQADWLPMYDVNGYRIYSLPVTGAAAVQIKAGSCSHCQSTDVIGPFEMDGVVDGVYREAGETWIVCRSCNCSTHMGTVVTTS